MKCAVRKQGSDKLRFDPRAVSLRFMHLMQCQCYYKNCVGLIILISQEAFKDALFPTVRLKEISDTFAQRLDGRENLSQ